MIVTCLALALASLGAVDVAVVCPPAFRAELRPWLEYRQAQGHEIELVDNGGSPEQIRDRIRRIAAGGTLRFIVLVGDADPAPGHDPAARARSVPVHLAAAKVGPLFGSEREIATDNWYADLDDDQAPDVAIGRLTVDTPDELAHMVRKILDYELNWQDAGWRRRVNLVAGLAGFSEMADVALEAAAKMLLTDGIPASYATSMTYASWRSPYCPDPRRFSQTTVERLNEGCLFWVYIGHGHHTFLDRVRTPAGQFHIMGRGDVPQLACRQGSPVALFLSCYSAAFDGDQDCLAEEMLRAEGGPVAAIGGSRMTMPYAMTVLGTKLLSECFQERRATVGEMLLHAKRNMAFDPRTDERSQLLDALAATLNPLSKDLAQERLEHLLLFNLLGDPLLRLRYGRSLSLETPAHTSAGGSLEISGASPIDGTAKVELVVRRDRLTFKPPSREQFDPSESAGGEQQRVYEQSNDARLSATQVTVSGGKFYATLAVPESAHGACHVRVLVQGRDDFAMGDAPLQIRRKAPGKKQD